MLDLNKKLDERKNKILDLSKTIGLRNQKSTVILALDYSGSMNELYRNGSVQELIERVLPLGLAFDDNGEVDFYLFETGFRKMPENITLQNVNGYIQNKIMGRYEFGGTRFAPVIKDIIQKFKPYKPLGGILGLGASVLDHPVYVLFVTDGENSDHQETETALIEASKYGIFFQFIGIGHESFSFLRKLDTMQGRKIDNANFCKIENPSAKTDDELYRLLLTEYPSFVMTARDMKYIK